MRVVKRGLVCCLSLGMTNIVLAQDGNDAVSVDMDQIVGIGTISQVYERWAGADGELSIAEWDAAVDQILGEEEVNLPVARWDTDSDSTITLEEFASAISDTAVFPLSPGQTRVSVRYSDWDLDRDGQISMEEWNDKVAEERLFANFDLDDDGVLDKDELEDDFFVWDLGEVDRNGDGSIADNEFGDGLFNTYDENTNDIIDETEFDIWGNDLGSAGLSDV